MKPQSLFLLSVLLVLQCCAGVEQHRVFFVNLLAINLLIRRYFWNTMNSFPSETNPCLIQEQSMAIFDGRPKKRFPLGIQETCRFSNRIINGIVFQITRQYDIAAMGVARSNYSNVMFSNKENSSELTFNNIFGRYYVAFRIFQRSLEKVHVVGLLQSLRVGV